MGNQVIVTQGLEPGDRYVVEGVLKVQPGLRVSAVSVDVASRQGEAGAKQVLPAKRGQGVGREPA
jgi:hypothetical protein